MSKIKLAIHILITVLIPVILVGILTFVNKDNTATENVHFARNMIRKPLKLLYKIDRPPNVTAFAAIKEKTYYFKTTNPALYFKTDLNLDHSELYKISSIKLTQPSGASFLFLDDSTLFLLDGNNGTIIDLSKTNATTHVFKFPVFTRATYISNNTFILRAATVINNLPDQLFIKVNLNNKTVIKENSLSSFLGDAGISTDGSLFFDETNNTLVYVYYYANKYINFDTSLNIKYSKATIYPDSGFHIHAGGIGSSANKLFTNTTASQVINWKADVNNGKLYINLPYMADNEQATLFKQSTVIDVYNLRTGSYLHSFYIPFCKKQKMEDFKIAGSNVLVVYQHNLAIYNLPF